MLNVSTIAISIHAVAAVVWVGGMFFAYMVLRPSLGAFDPPQRLALWSDVFSRFFFFVWISIIVLPVSGYLLVFYHLGGFRTAGLHVHIMHALGLVMIGLFVFLYYVLYRPFRNAVAVKDWSLASKHLNSMRRVISVNMVLGLFTIFTGASGRFWI